jgi:hypothetical protein
MVSVLEIGSMTDFLPLISTLSGAIVGGLIGFLTAWRVGVRRQNYELKKEAYYAFLKLDRAQKPLAPSQWEQEYFFAKNSIDLWGSQKVKRMVEDMRSKGNWKDTGYFFKFIKEEFLPAIKEDLSKPWWKLW